MKVIFSRKGFDSSNGGCASPIMPDGTLLSLPIPSGDCASFSDVIWKDFTYAEILKQICPKKTFTHCHIDPDVRDNRKDHIEEWKPAFGQTGSAQGLLANAGVEIGDIFLFFGWFRRIRETENGYRYAPRNKDDFYGGNDLQVIYGYMQIGSIITDQDEIRNYYWHPHSSDKHTENPNNTLYLPSDRLSFNPDMKGYGTLDYREDRVLTMEGKGRATWKNYEFLLPEHVYGTKKNCAKGTGLYYAGIWQELVVYESKELIDWVRNVVK